MVRVALIAGLLALACFNAGAQGIAPDIDMKPPRISPAAVDWNAATAELAAIVPDQPPTLAQLNEATAALFPGIADSPVPVLLPFDTPAFWRARIAPKAEPNPAETLTPAAATPDAKAQHMAGFNLSPFFFPGPSGYDAALSLRASDMPELGLQFGPPITVMISGSALRYQLDPAVGATPAPVKELQAAFPGIQRLILESHVRYTFMRYGVPYLVSINCFDGPVRVRRLSCREADKVAMRFLKALHVAGGTPRTLQAQPPQTIERPEALSPLFTFHAPGDLIPGTGKRGHGGDPDTTVYARIRFPMRDAPAYANSQSFNNWGDCNFTGRSPRWLHTKGAPYRCRISNKPLVFDESAGGNYAYPWRDNFCETRDFFVGQCPAGLGHQGQDIRPADCQLRNEGADRCQPYRHNVVAVRDGMILRAPGDQMVYLVVDAPGEHIRFRYLHMSPTQLDQDGIVNGKRVREGDVIGKVGNYNRRPGGTTYHLHFDVQVPTEHGWVLVNPYMTLVSAYERLIGGRGTVVRDAVPIKPEDLPKDDSHVKEDGQAKEENQVSTPSNATPAVHTVIQASPVSTPAIMAPIKHLKQAVAVRVHKVRKRWRHWRGRQY
ncbi:MAG: peptidase [Xanthobacteraceae bacterium]|nr:peptidase [Xanthobacteraceae bacterium]